MIQIVLLAVISTYAFTETLQLSATVIRNI